MNQLIKLKPLTMIALSSQLYRLTGGDFYSDRNFMSEDGSEPNAKCENILIHKPTGRRFQLATQEQEEKAKEFKNQLRIEADARAKNKYNHILSPFIDYNNSNRWEQGLNALEGGKIIEMCEDAYYNFLESVPPKRMERGAYCSGEPSHHNKEGQAVYICGLERKGKFYAQYGTVKQFESRELFKSLPLREVA